ncbi:MAG TPA: hypothetical protein V6C65_28105 [Allocoleopsis sp.]
MHPAGMIGLLWLSHDFYVGENTESGKIGTIDRTWGRESCSPLLKDESRSEKVNTGLARSDSPVE